MRVVSCKSKALLRRGVVWKAWHDQASEAAAMQGVQRRERNLAPSSTAQCATEEKGRLARISVVRTNYEKPARGLRAQPQARRYAQPRAILRSPWSCQPPGVKPLARARRLALIARKISAGAKGSTRKPVGRNSKITERCVRKDQNRLPMSHSLLKIHHAKKRFEATSQ